MAAYRRCVCSLWFRWIQFRHCQRGLSKWTAGGGVTIFVGRFVRTPRMQYGHQINAPVLCLSLSVCVCSLSAVGCAEYSYSGLTAGWGIAPRQNTTRNSLSPLSSKSDSKSPSHIAGDIFWPLIDPSAPLQYSTPSVRFSIHGGAEKKPDHLADVSHKWCP